MHQPAGFRPTEGNTVNRNVSTGDGVRAGAGLEVSGPAAGTGVKDTDVFLNTVVGRTAPGRRSAVRFTDPVDTAEVHDNPLVARGGAALVDAVGGSDLLRFERNTYDHRRRRLPRALGRRPLHQPGRLARRHRAGADRRLALRPAAADHRRQLAAGLAPARRGRRRTAPAGRRTAPASGRRARRP